MTETYRLMGRHEEALADLNRAIGLDKSGWTYYQIALVDLTRGRVHDAQKQLKQALHAEREQILESPGNGWRRTR